MKESDPSGSSRADHLISAEAPYSSFRDGEGFRKKNICLQIKNIQLLDSKQLNTLKKIIILF